MLQLIEWDQTGTRDMALAVFFGLPHVDQDELPFMMGTSLSRRSAKLLTPVTFSVLVARLCIRRGTRNPFPCQLLRSRHGQVLAQRTESAATT